MPLMKLAELIGYCRTRPTVNGRAHATKPAKAGYPVHV
jgi:hypothetical protein